MPGDRNGNGAGRETRRPLQLRVVARLAQIQCPDPGLRATLAAVYAAMRTSGGDADIQFAVAATKTNLVVEDPAGGSRSAAGLSGLLALIDDALAVGFQRLRPDLLFLHAAALESGGRAFLLVAPSGGGKSTTAWALTQHGFRYLSDELAPVDLARLMVHPYPRALGLKDSPPAPYGLPAGALVSGRNAWVTPHTLPLRMPADAVPVTAIFFLDRRTSRAAEVRRLTASEATIRLYANTLNPLAHPADGLDAVIGVISRTASYELPTGDLASTHLRIRRALNHRD